ncbi:MAG: hypothetical protein AAF485_30445 [Chloroflexota bacterium]
MCPRCLVLFAIGKDPDEGLAVAEEIENESSEAIGSTIGRYRVLEQIGEGGFGAVYMAEQREPVVRILTLSIGKRIRWLTGLWKVKLWVMMQLLLERQMDSK